MSGPHAFFELQGGCPIVGANAFVPAEFLSTSPIIYRSALNSANLLQKFHLVCAPQQDGANAASPTISGMLQDASNHVNGAAKVMVANGLAITAFDLLNSKTADLQWLEHGPLANGVSYQTVDELIDYFPAALISITCLNCHRKGRKGYFTVRFVDDSNSSSGARMKLVHSQLAAEFTSSTFALTAADVNDCQSTGTAAFDFRFRARLRDRAGTTYTTIINSTLGAQLFGRTAEALIQMYLDEAEGKRDEAKTIVRRLLTNGPTFNAIAVAPNDSNAQNYRSGSSTVAPMVFLNPIVSIIPTANAATN